MKKIIHFLLKYSGTIREYTDKKGIKQHKFNKWNPIGYLVLIVVAIISGLIEFLKVFFGIIKQTLKEAYAN